MTKLSNKALVKVDRNKKVVDMYLRGDSIDDIYAASGFRSRSSVFRILNNAKIKLTRGHTRGPLGPRKKKEDVDE